MAGYGLPAHTAALRERHRRRALSELRTGVHWGPEERARLLGDARPPLAQRKCPHCERLGAAAAAETAAHIVFDCALYAELRPRYPQLFPAPTFEGQGPAERPALGAFLTGDHVTDGERQIGRASCRERV